MCVRFAASLTATGTILYVALSAGNYVGQKFGLGILYAIIAFGFMVLAGILLIIARRLFANENRRPTRVYVL